MEEEPSTVYGFLRWCEAQSSNVSRNCPQRWLKAAVHWRTSKGNANADLESWGHDALKAKNSEGYCRSVLQYILIEPRRDICVCWSLLWLHMHCCYSLQARYPQSPSFSSKHWTKCCSSGPFSHEYEHISTPLFATLAGITIVLCLLHFDRERRAWCFDSQSRVHEDCRHSCLLTASCDDSYFGPELASSCYVSQASWKLLITPFHGLVQKRLYHAKEGPSESSHVVLAASWTLHVHWGIWILPYTWLGTRVGDWP